MRLETLSEELRLAVRLLGRAPALSFTVVATLGLALAASITRAAAIKPSRIDSVNGPAPVPAIGIFTAVRPGSAILTFPSMFAAPRKRTLFSMARTVR